MKSIRGGRAFRLSVGGVLTTLLAGGGALAAFAATSTGTSGGVIHVYETSNKGPSSPGSVVITGAINDGGVGSATGGKTGNGKVVLSHGSIKDVASAALLTKEQDLYGRAIKPPGCSLVGTISGPVKIVGGTGAYAGISGTVHATYTVAAVLPKLQSGKCDTRHHVRPIGVAIFIKASGSVSFK